jgi:outer membrane protein OmpA-like peptidoglycan-associated protein
MNTKALLALLALLAYCGFGVWWWNNQKKDCNCNNTNSSIAAINTNTDLPLAFNWDKNEVIKGNGFDAYINEQIKNLGPTDTLTIKTWYYDGETNGEQIAQQRAEAIKALYPNVAPRFKVITEKRSAEDKYKTEKFAAAEFNVIRNANSLVKKEDNKITIYFASNAKSDNIPKEIDDVLTQLANDMKANANITVQTTGHTDNVGDDAKNMILSTNRAEFAKSLLVKKGADVSKITATGKGETQPAATNDTDDGRKQNRRVEFLINK